MRGLIVAMTIFVAACATEEQPEPDCSVEEQAQVECQERIDSTPDPTDGCTLTYVIWLRCMAGCNEWDCDLRR